ncbi:MAG: phospho-N-acetylmuramoyl-pentapeptide-transferase, partial [Gammaproteobacteria bacterium]|nr:phospho-N-acetylmuramoyl-pentapeptide-transferase [Gammaproteobacteria bacterium]
MLLWLTQHLTNNWHFLHVFQYITFRCILTALTALIISLLIGQPLIKWLGHFQIGQTVRDDGPQTHLKKAGTPTMGGVSILLSIACAVLLWSDLSNRYIWVTLTVMLSFGLIGGVDDYLKIV